MRLAGQSVAVDLIQGARARFGSGYARYDGAAGPLRTRV